MANLFSLIAVVIITLLYFFAKEHIKNNLSPAVQTSLPFIYLLIMILVQIGTNSVAIKKLCGKNNFDLKRVLMATIIPWVSIFGLLIIILRLFPGWKSPFSNTIGYLFIRGDAEKIIPEIFKGKMTGKDTGSAAQALEFIYDDQSMLINEITPLNFDTFWNKMQSSNLFQQNANNYKEELRRIVKLKDIIATGVWYLMAGFLVTSFSYQNMISAKCEKKIEDLNKSEHKHKEQLEKEKKSKENKKVYKSRE